MPEDDLNKYNADVERLRQWIGEIKAPRPRAYIPYVDPQVRPAAPPEGNEVGVFFQNLPPAAIRPLQRIQREDEGMNLKNVQPVNLTDVGKPRVSRVYRVGIELEGGWDKLPKGIAKIEHDGSVKFNGIVRPLKGQGELQSPPLGLAVWKDWVKEHYPDHINESCGLHVHLSLKSALTYQRLMVPQYPATVLAQFKLWSKKVNLPADHPIWDRMAGKSEYCRLVFSADDQVLNVERDFNKERRGNRYTIVNYAWGRHGTAETRLLPAMPTMDLAIEAIEELINITDKFLLATAKKEAKVRGEGLLSNKETREVRDVRVRL